jgi:hypothetical protein
MRSSPDASSPLLINQNPCLRPVVWVARKITVSDRGKGVTADQTPPSLLVRRRHCDSGGDRLGIFVHVDGYKVARCGKRCETISDQSLDRTPSRSGNQTRRGPSRGHSGLPRPAEAPPARNGIPSPT